jgi:hypothetical protein
MGHASWCHISEDTSGDSAEDRLKNVCPSLLAMAQKEPDLPEPRILLGVDAVGHQL